MLCALPGWRGFRSAPKVRCRVGGAGLPLFQEPTGPLPRSLAAAGGEPARRAPEMPAARAADPTAPAGAAAGTLAPFETLCPLTWTSGGRSSSWPESLIAPSCLGRNDARAGPSPASWWTTPTPHQERTTEPYLAAEAGRPSP
ncbi:MAPK regulated corepressor interacting protein 2 isoform X2 [Ursus maritimus]|uniref:MAPK regulated corepressor interacting protein 2 isoform X2 n=1 Tax=Ursus maritimus TaxID=29073 RepID=A0A8M1GA50_URSMA|nr:MAPK regulated corepressor interacting protein 2 isoform X2 [Ursus maritimus]